MPSKYATREEATAYLQRYRQMNRVKIREYNREYNKKWRKKNGYQNEKNSKLRYPKKEKARRILSKAVSLGKVKRLPCQICKEKRSQAHHPNYEKPLEVTWLCALHHMRIHKRNGYK